MEHPTSKRLITVESPVMSANIFLLGGKKKPGEKTNKKTGLS